MIADGIKNERKDIVPSLQEQVVSWCSRDQDDFADQAFGRGYMESPCTVCGSGQHQLLDLVDGMDGNREWVYTCPVVLQEIWAMWKRRSRRFKICPVKLAYSCNLRVEKVEEVMQEYMTCGEGRYTPATDSAELHLRATQICREE